MLKDFPQIPIILDRKNHKSRNLVIGTSPLQIEFLQWVLESETGNKHTVKEIESICDEDLHTMKADIIYVMEKEKIELSDDYRDRIGIWLNRPVTKRSAASYSIIRRAHNLLGKTYEKKALDTASDFIFYRDREDLVPALQETMTFLLAKKTPLSKKVSIWEDPIGWIQQGEDLDRKLNYLRLEMSWFVFAQTDEWQKAKSTGCSPSKFKWLKSCRFNLNKVRMTIETMNKHKSTGCSSYRLALELASIWS